MFGDSPQLRGELPNFAGLPTVVAFLRKLTSKARTNYFLLTHWGRLTHICVGNLTIIGSDNGLSPERRQTIIWTNAGLLLIGTLWTNFSEILIGIRILSFKKMGLKVSSAKWRPFCLGLNVLSMPANESTVASHTIGCEIPLGTVKITIGWRQFQSASNIQLKFCLFWKCERHIGIHLAREPVASALLTLCWT